jgi:hypothetical protein
VDLSSLNKRKLLCAKIKTKFDAQNTWDEKNYPWNCLLNIAGSYQVPSKRDSSARKQLKIESEIFMRSYKYYVCQIL